MRQGILTGLWAVLLLLTGCGAEGLPYAREMGDMALMRTMGVDVGSDPERVAVTVSSGRRARGLQGEAEPPLVLAAERGSLSGACLAIQGLSDSYVFYGHVDQLLLGEELVRQGAAETLEYFGQEGQLGLGAQVWVIRNGTAGEAIAAGGEQGVDSRLTTIQTDSEMGAAGITRTAGETLTALLEDGAAYLPGLSLQEGGLLEAGYAVLKDGALAGWLMGENARGLELAAGQMGTGVLELTVEGGWAAVQMSSASASCTPVFEGETLAGLKVDCQLSLRLKESRGNPEPDQLRRAAEELEGKRVEGALAQLQQWNADCLGLARRAGQADGARWSAQRAQWEEAFPTLEITVTVRAALNTP